MNKMEAYKECGQYMEQAAFNIRAPALFSYSDFYIEPPKSKHGGWIRDHLYWLYCMEYVLRQPDDSDFKIENDHLLISTEHGYEIVNRE